MFGRIQYFHALSSSSSKLVSAYDKLLSSRLPRFQVDPANIEFLTTPQRFYESMMQGIQTATQRIVISTLYIGNDAKAQALLEAIKKRLREHEEIKLVIIVDSNRTLRGPAVAGAMEKNPGSVKEAQSQDGNYAKLRDLVSEFGSNRVKVALFPSPPWPLLGLPKWVFDKLGTRVHELRSVFHAKVYIFDTRVTLSGANLSYVYFTTRQDRYVSILCPKVSQFYAGLVQVLCGASFCICDTSASERLSSIKPFTNSKLRSLRENLMDLFKANISLQVPFQASSHEANVRHTFVYPSIQYAWAGIDVDVATTLEILNYAQSNDEDQISGNLEIFLTAGYLNLTDEIWTALRKHGGKCTVLGASVEANGWYGAKGTLTRYVPRLYEARMQSLLEKGVSPKVLAWGHQAHRGWSYHAKGVWIGKLDEGSGKQAPAMKPFLHITGSSNYNYRSADRDFEAQALILTDDEKLRNKMAMEISNLRKAAETVNERESQNPAYSLISKLSWLVRSFL